MFTVKKIKKKKSPEGRGVSRTPEKQKSIDKADRKKLRVDKTQYVPCTEQHICVPEKAWKKFIYGFIQCPWLI